MLSREDSLLAQLGLQELIVQRQQRANNIGSLYEMAFEVKGVRESRPRRSISILAGDRLGLASVEEGSKIFGVKLEMDIDLCRLGRWGWNRNDRWYQRRNQGEECGVIRCGFLRALAIVVNWMVNNEKETG